MCSTCMHRLTSTGMHTHTWTQRRLRFDQAVIKYTMSQTHKQAQNHMHTLWRSGFMPFYSSSLHFLSLPLWLALSHRSVLVNMNSVKDSALIKPSWFGGSTSNVFCICLAAVCVSLWLFCCFDTESCSQQLSHSSSQTFWFVTSQIFLLFYMI